MRLEKLNPFIRYANMHETYYSYKENSICYDCRVFYVQQGNGSLFVNGQNYDIKQGTFVFLPPNSQYRFFFTSPNDVKIYVLNFDLVDDFCHVTKSLGTAQESTYDPTKSPTYPLPAELSAPIIQKNDLYAHTHMTACVELFLQNTAYYKHLSSAYLKLALIELLQEQHSEDTAYRLVQNVQEFIRNNYFNPDLDNQSIAEQFNYHPYHINRLMKAHTHKTLHEYLLEYRLHMAKSFLRTTALNVTAIAEKTGFASYTYFIKIFRERIGISPIQYRKKNKNVGF